MLLSTLNKDPKEPFDVIYKAPDLWRTDSFWRPESKVNALWNFIRRRVNLPSGYLT